MSKNIIAVAIIVGALIVAGAVIYSAKVSPQSPGTYDLGNDKESEESPGLSVEGEPSLGSPEAKVTIVEFSDFQCPFCARYTLETFPQIKQEFVDTGKIKMVFKNFPLANHANAKIAAEASECANDQGKFWEYKSTLFRDQQALAASDLKKYAKDLGLDETTFNSCLDSKKYSDEVSGDLEDGLSAGVTGTPTFFINGEKLVGAYPFSEFQRIINQKLAE